MANIEKLNAVLELVENEPKKYEQMYWEDRDPECGTTRCLAGWAIALEYAEHFPEGEAKSLVEMVYAMDPNPATMDYVDIAAKILDIPYTDAQLAFETTNSNEAMAQYREIIRRASGGYNYTPSDVHED